MTRRSGAFQFVWPFLCLGLILLGLGCSKKAVSSSGDQSAGAEARKSGTIETITPDQMASVPESKRTPTEAGRESLTPSSESAAGRSQAVTPSEPMGSSASAARFGTGSLSDVFFDFDRYTIRADAQPVLESDAVWIKNSSAKSILIEGHCDERGTQAYNLVLGEKRARATKQYLQDLGVPASRLKIVSYGEVRPFCNGRDEQCYQLNRRAHFVPQ